MIDRLLDIAAERGEPIEPLQQRIAHLLSPLPPEMRNDTAFMDRIHAFVPGWDFPKLKTYGPNEGQILLVGWGSSEGPIKEAVDRARGIGEAISGLSIKYINPLPNGLEQIFKGFHHIFVVELNDEGIYGYGQLAAVLRARYCDARIQGITKADGLTWKVKEILDHARKLVSAND